MASTRDSNHIFVDENNRISSAFSSEAQEALFAVEDNSWWFQYRAQVLIDVAERCFSRECETLDIGGGNGYTTSRLQQEGFTMALLEPSYAACAHAKRRGIPRCICGVLEDFGEPISQCLLLDVLEHIQDDMGFLRSLSARMTPGGKLLLTVPAFSMLWSSEDEAAGHFRRYHLPVLRKLMESNGFHVLYGTYFFSFLFFPILFVRVGLEKLGLLKRQEMRTDEERKKIMKKQFEMRGGFVGAVLESVESWERKRLVCEKSITFGSSILCVATRA